MLDEIRVQNLGLIEEAILTPGPGFTVITGETGAGKTLMLGALRMVRGDKARKGTIGPHGDSVDVAVRMFQGDGSETVARRVVRGSRSRAYLDGTPATAKELAASVGPRISIVAQHDQHTIATSEGIRRLIDAMFTAGEQPVLEAYGEAYQALRDVEAEMDALGSDTRSLERELEMTRFQIAEIDEAGFAEGDEEELRSRLARLRHAEEINEEVTVASDSLGESGVDAMIRRGVSALERVSRLDGDAAGLSVRLSEIATAVHELSADLSRYAVTVESDPGALATDEQRIAELSSLKRKYGDTISDISAFAKQALERSTTIIGFLDAAESLEERHSSALHTLAEATQALRAVRTQHASDAARTTQSHLLDLGFTDPVVRIEIDAKLATATGADSFTIMFASDMTLTPEPIASIASGGELSRLVLAITLACGVADTEVVAFDEIDAGIGGSTALAMGEKLAALARTRQVICVTHLPQVAAYGSCHYRVVRDGTTATIEKVAGHGRVEEISRMLAGMEGSDRGMRHAEELLGMAADTPDDGSET